MSDIHADFDKFKDQYGLISPDGKPSGNGLVYTAAYLLTLRDHWLLGLNEVFEGINALTSCFVTWGLLKRHPDHTDQEGPDDYIAVGLISHLCGSEYAKSILSYGRSNPMRWFGIDFYYVYNNEWPGSFLHKDQRTNWSAWMGRFPALICHLQWASGERPCLFRRLYWCAMLLISARKKRGNQDAWIQSYMMCEVAKNRWWLSDKVIKYWECKFKLTFSDGIGQVWAEYFGNPNHPLAKYSSIL